MSDGTATLVREELGRNVNSEWTTFRRSTNCFIRRLIESREKFLAFSGWADSDARVIQSGFLTKEDREKLIAMTRDGSLAHWFTRRANALVLLDDRWNCQQVAHALLLDDDTFRGWRKLFEQLGEASAIRSPTTSASSTERLFWF